MTLSICVDYASTGRGTCDTAGHTVPLHNFVHSAQTNVWRIFSNRVVWPTFTVQMLSIALSSER